jgi:penicillin-binding protein 1A
MLRFIVRLALGVENRLFSEKKSFYAYLGSYLLFGSLSGLLIFAALLQVVNLNSVIELSQHKPPVPSQLVDKNGKIITTFFENQRIVIEKNQMPQCLSEAFIATEDNHFYNHFGLDPQAIFRAFLINLKAGYVVQGGSTITQQLSKVVLTGQQRTYTRKLKEAVLSIMIDAMYEKDQILMLYLNQIYFGHGTYGVEAAANFYFDKSAEDLVLGECAILATLPSAPNRYSPVRNPRLSVKRLAHVLMKMIDLQFISIDQAMYAFSDRIDYYANLNIPSTATAFGQRMDLAPHVTESLRSSVESLIGKKALYGKGYSIKTTIDLDHQQAAQEALWSKLHSMEDANPEKVQRIGLKVAKSYSDTLDPLMLIFDVGPFKQNTKTYMQKEFQIEFTETLLDQSEMLNLGMGADANFQKSLRRIRKFSPMLQRFTEVQGAFIELDHQTGKITAMVGGSPFSSTNQLNRAIQMKRQPGSTFKALLYAAAMESEQITAASIFPDTPLVFLDAEGDAWLPENYSGDYTGFINIRNALAYSTNVVSVAVAREAGMDNLHPLLAQIIDVEEKAIPRNYSVALGSFEMTPLNLAKSFSMFPRGGTILEACLIESIHDDEGQQVKLGKKWPFCQTKPAERTVISKGVATVLSDLLQNVVNKGTANYIRKVGYRGFAGGKTGTTSNYRDAWFAGYNQRYTSVVWVGYDRPSIGLGSGQSGGTVAVPIWADYHLKISASLKNDEAYLISGGTEKASICKTYGMPPGQHCNIVYEEIFAKGTIPVYDASKVPVVSNISNVDEDLKVIVPMSKTDSVQLYPENFFEGDDILE